MDGAVSTHASSSPFGINSKKFGMWLFIVSDALTFSTLLVCYTYLRMSSPNWPAPFKFSPSILFSTLMTLVLLTSSLTMVKGWLRATMFFGATFVVLHLTEWKHLLAEGITPSTPFGATFFTITGLHMVHVTIGIIYLGIIAARRYPQEDIEVAGLYWHFVDLVWMFIFPLIYLMSVQR